MQFIIIGLVLIGWPSVVFADIIWPGLILETKLMSIWPIITGLIIELLVLRFGGFGLFWKRAAIIDIVMNAASAGVGFVLIPFGSFIVTILTGLVFLGFKPVFELNLATSNVILWTVTYIFTVFITTLIEAFVVLSFSIILTRRRLAMLLFANALSVGIALISGIKYPPKL